MAKTPCAKDSCDCLTATMRICRGCGEEFKIGRFYVTHAHEPVNIHHPLPDGKTHRRWACTKCSVAGKRETGAMSAGWFGEMVRREERGE